MKNKSLKKKIFFWIASFAFVSTMTSSLAINLNRETSNSQNIVKNNSSLNDAQTQTVASQTPTTNLIPWNQTKDGSTNLNTPRQYIAFDNLNSSYVILNSDTQVQSATITTTVAAAQTNSEPSFDNITMFNMSSGKAKWNKKVSELGSSLKDKQVSITNGTFLAVAYLQGYLSNDNMVLTIVKDTSSSKYYFVALKWSDGTVVSINEIQNSAEKEVKDNSNTANEQYFISVNNFINLNINISSIKTESDNNKVTYSSYTITSVPKTLDEKTISLKQQELPQEVSSKFLANNSQITDFYTDANSYNYVFQQNTLAQENSAVSNFVTILKVGKNQDIKTISASNFMSLNLTADEVKLFQDSSTQENLEEKQVLNVTNVPIVTHVIGSNNDNYLLISQKKESKEKESTPTDNTYLIAKYTTSDFQNNTSINFKQLSTKDNGFVLSLNPLYSSTEKNTITGYIGLSSNNKAIYFSKDFSATQIYYDFDTLNVAKSKEEVSVSSTNINKKIFTIFTKPNEANWYAQMIDGSIIQFSGSNLIGQLDKIVGQERTEILANVSFKPESEISPEIVYYDASSSDFKTFISNNASSFLNINSSDPVFGTPLISAEIDSNNSITKGKNSDVTISFYQQLRKRATNGNITNNGPKVLIGYKDYTFINEDLFVTVKDKADVPSSITSKYPSKVTEDEVKQILNISNGTNYQMSLQPNDALGTLTVNLTFPYVWTVGKLNVNYKYSVTIGDANNPYFMVDLLNGLDASVNLVTDEYLNQESNKDYKTALSVKYGTMLASEISKENVLNDFVLLGDAFNDVQLINQNLIEKPTKDNIQVVPVDTEGYLYITVTIPKIGTNTNVTYSFKSAQVFLKSATSSQNAYIIFKDTDEVKKTSITVGNDGKTELLGSYTPSKIATQIKSDKTWLLYFANISYYILNMLYSPQDSNNPEAKLNIITNDGLGQIKISIEFTNEVQGLDGKVFEKTFDGFAKQGNSGAPSGSTSYPTFTWGTLDNNEFNGKTPSDITASYISSLSSKLFVLNGASQTLRKTISVSPLNASGAVLVTVTFYNWWEKQTIDGEQQPVLLPEKTFQTILTNGLRSTKDPSNVIVWKSYDELDANIKNSTASNALATINSSADTDLAKLQKVANISDALLKQLNEKSSNLTLSITTNNSLGYLEVYAKFTLDGKTQSFGTKISGFDLESPNYVVTLASDTSETVNQLKGYLPSQLTDQQIGSLVNVQLGNNFSRRITTRYDDINGTLSLKVELFQSNSNGTTSDVIPSIQRTYYGFKTNVPEYKGTNYLIIGLSIAIPIILLLAPILFIIFYKNRKDVRRFAKVLDKRLSEMEGREKHVNVDTIEDLLSIEKD